MSARIANLIFERLEQLNGQLGSLARETAQAILKPHYAALVKKLNGDDPLSGEDLQLLEMIVVGDAKYYATHENDYDNWISELERLTTAIQNIGLGSEDEVSALMHLQALCTDAAGVLRSITRYLREKERVDTFERAVSGSLTSEDRKILADVISATISSKTM